MATLTIDQATKSFGGIQVLHGIDIDIEDGEFVVLVGPSGCGKSTLLRLIAGLEDITSGEIRIDGADVSRRHPKDRDIAMVFQSYALYPHMTVAENMGFSLRMRGAKADEQRRKVEEAAGILDLGPLLDRYPRQLSGGQRQRVAMGRAIVRNPKVFLFDEPLSNLDAKLRVQMRTEIRSLHKALKTTIVYVTHDQIEAMTMADKIVVMRGGHVEQIGSPMAVYDAPANVFVAGFIGSPAMNLLPGRIGDDARCLEIEGGGVLGFDKRFANSPVRPVILGIRPEDVMLDEAGSPALVKLIEPTGADLSVSFDVSGNEITAVFRERLSLQEGDTVGLSLRSDRLHLFDPSTTVRLDA